MDNLTVAILATMEADRGMYHQNRNIAKLVNDNRPVRQPYHVTAEEVGSGICTFIGERLSKVGLNVPKDGMHELLWMTFMGSVDWTAIGKSYLDELKGDEG